jgi:hypothetical protein
MTNEIGKTTNSLHDRTPKSHIPYPRHRRYAAPLAAASACRAVFGNN